MCGSVADNRFVPAFLWSFFFAFDILMDRISQIQAYFLQYKDRSSISSLTPSGVNAMKISTNYIRTAITRDPGFQ
jgi:hypothetical protein